MCCVRRGPLIVICAALLLAPAGLASPAPLSARLASALAAAGNPATASGAVVVDLRTGRLLFTRNPDLPLAPASNEKLTVTYTALRELGPTYRFRTEVFGRGHQEGTVWHGDVFLKGFGDPTLTSLQVERLATQIAALGITRIDGRRVLVRHAANGTGLESVVLHRGVPAAVGADRRPRLVRPPHRAPAGARRSRRVQALAPRAWRRFGCRRNRSGPR